MAYPILSNFPLSMASGLKKTPVFNTVRQKSAAGISSAIALQPYPTWQFEFSLDHIQGNESAATSVVAKFLSIFMQTAGGAGLFLFSDAQDNTVTGAQFGTGNGTTTAFQLSRNIDGAVDIIQTTNGTPTIYVNGTVTAPASISPTGVVTFSSAPANNAVLTWAGGFYYACRFGEDTVDSTRTFTVNNGIDQWVFDGIKFTSEFLPASTYGAIATPGGA